MQLESVVQNSQSTRCWGWPASTTVRELPNKHARLQKERNLLHLIAGMLIFPFHVRLNFYQCFICIDYITSAIHFLAQDTVEWHRRLQLSDNLMEIGMNKNPLHQKNAAGNSGMAILLGEGNMVGGEERMPCITKQKKARVCHVGLCYNAVHTLPISLALIQEWFPFSVNKSCFIQCWMQGR